MRWKSKKSHEIITRKVFAFLPIKINNETRWLEFVKIKGYWWKGASGNWWWVNQQFVD